MKVLRYILQKWERLGRLAVPVVIFPAVMFVMFFLFYPLATIILRGAMRYDRFEFAAIAAVAAAVAGLPIAYKIFVEFSRQALVADRREEVRD